MNLIEHALSQTATGRREIKRQDLIVSVTEQIWAAMETAGVTKSDLARLLGQSKSHVTQLLSGDRNMTLATLADIAAALDLSPCIQLGQAPEIMSTVGGRVRDVERRVAMRVLERHEAKAENVQPIVLNRKPALTVTSSTGQAIYSVSN